MVMMASGKAAPGLDMVQTSITYKLAALSEDAIGSASRIFTKRFGLHVHQIRVLRLIADEPGITFTQLARQSKIERSATSRIVSKLIRGGFVRRVNVDSDARQFQLFVTAKGLKLRERADPLTVEIEGLIMSVLDEGERRVFNAAVEKLSAWVHGDYGGILAARYPEVAQPKPRARAAPSARKSDGESDVEAKAVARDADG